MTLAPIPQHRPFPSIERAGILRRGLAGLVDLVLAQVLLQSLVAIAFALTAGHVTTTQSLYTVCETIDIAPDKIVLPEGVTLPPGFAANNQGTCRSSIFGATTRIVFVASHVEHNGNSTTRLSQAYPVDPAGRAAARTADVSVLFLPLFLLFRWTLDRHAGGSPGRRLARISVTDAAGAATGPALAGGLARRYARFAWPLIPAVVLNAAAQVDALIVGSVQPVFSSLDWAAGGITVGAASLAATLSILRHTDTFYDAPVGTVVAPRSQLRTPETAPARPPAAAVALGADLLAAIATACRAPPWLSIAIVALMAAVYAAEVWRPAAPPAPDGPSLQTLLAYGAMNREVVVAMGQSHRLFTAILLHGSIPHLLTNGFALLVAGWLLEGLLGRILFLGVFVVGGLAASLTSVLVNPADLVSVGSSGAIQALLATSLVLAGRLPKSPRRAWMRAWPVVFGVPALMPAVGLPIGLGIDRADHVGGTIAGLLLGLAIALAWRGGVRRRPSRRVGVIAGGLLVGACALSITLAGWRHPILSVRLVPPDETPKDDAGWRARGRDLAARYPDDPRALLGAAMQEASERARDAALRDLDRALAAQRRLSPATAADFRFIAHADVASQFFGAGDLDAAMTEYGLVVAERATAEAFRQRGIAAFYRKRYGEAVADLRQALAIDPHEAYSVLWRSIVAERSGQPDPIATTANSVDPERWPAPIVGFFNGIVTPDALMRTAETLDATDDRHRICEAKFYIGEKLIAQHRFGEARPLIETAAATCPHDFIEYRGAEEELAGAAGFATE